MLWIKHLNRDVTGQGELNEIFLPCSLYNKLNKIFQLSETTIYNMAYKLFVDVLRTVDMVYGPDREDDFISFKKYLIVGIFLRGIICNFC